MVFTEEFRVPDKMVGLIIGKGGEQITRLQAETGCKIQLAPDSGGLPDRPCQLTGSAASIGACKQQMQDIIAIGQIGNVMEMMGGGGGGDVGNGGMYGDMQTVVEMLIPGNKVGLIIGKGGETIKVLQERAGVKMVMIQDSNIQTYYEKPLIITGDPQNCQRAKEMVMNLLHVLAEKEMEKEDIGVEKVKWVLCTEHDDKSLEYFCIKHEKPCCILCKRKYHRHCCEVEKVEDVIDETKVASITEDFLSGIEEHKIRLTKVANNERSNLRDLEILKDNCTADLKNTRVAIEEHLDILQNDVEQEMNRKYEEDSGEINKRLTDLSAKLNYDTEQQKMIRDIAKESTTSVGQKYLRIMHFEHLKSSYNESKENIIYEL
ncbi:FUBP [Mytilus coruscus]|uniref:FUBP n=1 Tax=Mytilus coruscus TaxID=42192 RepID=A0A6J8C9E5_MYTCO|nr:FUBP [Mytilus coruscus]